MPRRWRWRESEFEFERANIQEMMERGTRNGGFGGRRGGELCSVREAGNTLAIAGPIELARRTFSQPRRARLLSTLSLPPSFYGFSLTRSPPCVPWTVYTVHSTQLQLTILR